MACKSIETKHGDTVEIEDEIGHPIGLRVENDEGGCFTVYLSVENARDIAEALNAFAVIHSPAANR